MAKVHILGRFVCSHVCAYGRRFAARQTEALDGRGVAIWVTLPFKSV